MPRIYATAADHLTYNPYPIQCPAYAIRLAGPVEDGLIEPVYDAFDASAMVRSRRTIVQIMDLLKKRIPFVILQDGDVLLMLNEIDKYLVEIKSFPQTDELKSFLGDLFPLRNVLLKMKRRVLNLHPDWAARYRGADIGYLKLLYNMLEAAGIKIQGHSADEVVSNIMPSASPITLPSLKDQLAAVEQSKTRKTSSGFDGGL
jgi:hypothetical protein